MTNTYIVMICIVLLILIGLIIASAWWTRRKTYVDPVELDSFLKDPIGFGKVGRGDA
jgi:uncharacterized iron-regulated membrane protein